MEASEKAIRSWFSNNLSYKLVALVISLILWMTILGRRDFVLTKVLPLDFVTTSNYRVVDQSSESITVKVSGPRQALKRFAENQEAQVLSINLIHRGPGKYEVVVPTERLDLPFGVKLISVRPKTLQVEIAEGGEERGGEKNEN